MKIDEFLPLADGWKKVTYFGHELIVPEWTKWLAIDSFGDVTCYESIPPKHDSFWGISECEHNDFFYA